MNWPTALNEFSTCLFTVEKKLQDLHTVDWSFVKDLQSFKEALSNLRIYFFVGTDKYELCEVFKSKILCEINSLEKLEFLEELLTHEIWSAFTYWLFAWTYTSLGRDEKLQLDEVVIIEKIIQGFRTKDSLHAALEIFKQSAKSVMLKSSDEFFWGRIFTEEINQNNSIYSYNIIIYVLPAIKQIFDADYIMENIYSLMESKAFKKHDWGLTILKLVLMERPYLIRKLRKYYSRFNETCSQIIFEILCKIKCKYNYQDVKFLSCFIRRGNNLKHLDEMMATFIRYNKSSRILNHFHTIAKQLIVSKCVEMVEKGAIILEHLIVVNSNDRLFAKYKLKPPLNFKDDVSLCLKRLDYATMQYIYPLLTEFDAEGLVEKSSVLKQFFEICIECETGHLDEKIIPFLKFISKKFIENEEVLRNDFINNLWEDITSLMTPDSIIKYRKRIYTYLKLFTISLKEFKGFIEPHHQIEDVIVILNNVYNIYFRNENDFDYTTLKYAEKLLTVTAELLVLSTKDKELDTEEITEIFANLELAMTCNMRFSATAVANFYKQFVSSQYLAFENFFYKYISKRLQEVTEALINDSSLRRSGEYRMLIHAFCSAVPEVCKKSFVEKIMRNLVGDLKSERVDPALKAVNVHCITQLIRDKQLKNYTDRFLAPLIYYCLLLANESYKLNAATSLLLEAIIKRILPNDDNEKNMCVEDLYYLYPNLMKLWDVIENESEPLESHKFSKILFLSIFQRTNTSNSCLIKSDYNLIINKCLKLLTKHKFNAAFAVDTLVAILPFDKLTIVFDYFIKQLPEADLNDCLFYWWLLNLLCSKYMAYTRNPHLEEQPIELYHTLSSTERFLLLERANVVGCGRKALFEFRTALVCMESFPSDLKHVHILEIQLKEAIHKNDFEEYSEKNFIPALLSKIKNKVAAEAFIRKLIVKMHDRRLKFKLIDDTLILDLDYQELHRDLQKSRKFAAFLAIILADNTDLYEKLPKRLKMAIEMHMSTPDDLTIAIAFSKYARLMDRKSTILLNSLHLLISTKYITFTFLNALCEIFNFNGGTSHNAIITLIDFDFLSKYFECKHELVDFLFRLIKLITRLTNCDCTLNVFSAKEVFFKAVETLKCENTLSESLLIPD